MNNTHSSRAPRPGLFSSLRSLLLLFFALQLALAQEFLHPGGLHTQADLDRMRSMVSSGTQPWLAGWNALLSDSQAQATYTPAPNANMGASRQRASADAHAAYLNTIRWYVSGDTAYADCAVRICNAWSAAVNQVPSGTDIPGLAGIPIAEFAQVGELLRIYPGWAPADFERFKGMMLTYLYPVCHDFLTRHNGACDTHYWANWDLCNMGAILSIGVLCDDRAKFDEAVTYFQSGAGNGCITRVVSTLHADGLGQWQESGRDQEHAQLGVGLLGALCEVAWNQGVDLYGQAGNRLLAGAEYVARSNLSLPVPYTTYDNCDSVRQYYLSGNGLGRIDDRPLWEMLYNHYGVRLGLSVPNVKAMAELTRPERGSADHFGYGSLTFTRSASASPYPAAPVPAGVTGLAAEAGVSRVVLHWNACPTAQGFRVQRATSLSGPFTTLASWSANTYPEFVDSTALNGTTYHYLVTPLNQSGLGADSSPVSATPLAAGALPDGWAMRDVGTVGTPGGATSSPAASGTVILVGHATTLGGTADAAGFAFRTVSGDCSITARVIDAGDTRGGLMIRESLDANARTLTLTLGDTGGRFTRFGTRSATGGSMSFQNGNQYTWAPVWFRLQRSGNTFTASQSSDGVTWFVVGTSSVPMSAECHLGLVSCGGTTTADHLALDGSFLPGPPLSLLAVNGPSRITLSWNPAANATAYKLYRASTRGGPYALLATSLAGTTYVDEGLVNGTSYHYVVSSLQGDFESVSSSEVFGTAGDVTHTWSATPSSGALGTAANWADATVPLSGESATFAASSITALTNDLTGLALTRMAFASSAPGYTLTGAALTLENSVLNSSASTQTLALPLVLSGTRTLDASAGALVVSGVISESVAASGLIKAGAQTLTLTGANTFTGDVVHATGTLMVAGVGTGTSGAPLSGALGRGMLRLSGGRLTSSAAATLYNHIVLQAGTTSMLSSSTANLTLAGNLSGAGNISESGANTGGTHLSGNNAAFTGTFSSSNATNHRVRFNSALSGSASANWVLSNSQTDGNGLNFGTGVISFGALSGSGQFRNDAASGTTATLSIGALNTNTTFSGTLVANGTRYLALTKVGSGILVLSGGHSFNGPTTVTAGALYVNAAFASPVTVTGGLFGGSGTTVASVTINAGGTLAPGNQGLGTFTTSSSLAFQSGASLAAQLNSSTSVADKVLASSVALNGASLVLSDLGSASLAAGTQFTLIDNTGSSPVSGTFAGHPEGALIVQGANYLRLSYVGGTGNDIVLTALTPPPVLATAGEADAQVAVPFTFPITASSSPSTYFATGLPAGLSVDSTSGLISGTPLQAGTFSIVLGASNATGSATAPLSLRVAKGVATITLAGLSPTYDGTPKAVVATTQPAGLSLVLNYNGSPEAPAKAGSYLVSAVVADANYSAALVDTLVIAKAPAALRLSGLKALYDGTPKAPQVETVPAGLAVSLAYDGGSASPVYPGSHPLLATITDDNYSGLAEAVLQIEVGARLRHLPTVDGLLDGSAQVVSAEGITLNNNASITADLLLPGVPSLRLNGSVSDVSIHSGPGLASPVNHLVTLNGNAFLSRLVTRVDPLALPAVEVPSLPEGTRTVILSVAGSTAGDFTTVRDLTVQGAAGLVVVPPGNYGTLIANGGLLAANPPGFVLGVEGASSPSLYSLNRLILNGKATLQVVGPVILTVGNTVVVNTSAGNTLHPEWLTLQVSGGGLTLANRATFNGILIAPNGTAQLNSLSRFRGRLTADRLTLAAQATFEELAPTE